MINPFRLQVVLKDENAYTIDCSLFLRSVTVEDAGKYKVTARNDLGESNATISLNFDSKLCTPHKHISTLNKMLGASGSEFEMNEGSRVQPVPLPFPLQFPPPSLDYFILPSARSLTSTFTTLGRQDAVI